MARKDKRRDRGRRRKQKKAKSKAPEARRNVYVHPVFGEIPMIPYNYELASGEALRGLDFDPDYKPKMPKGAVRGDIRAQEFCRMCHAPRYYYVDADRRCVQCGEHFVFSASEQKYWYESLKFHFDSVAIRCKRCRGRRRSDKALNSQLSQVAQTLRERPEDAAAWIAQAEALVRLHERTDQGDLQKALSSARKAEKLWPEHAPAIYWQARSQELLGRHDKALALYTRFLGRPGVKRHRASWRHAREALERAASASAGPEA